MISTPHKPSYMKLWCIFFRLSIIHKQLIRIFYMYKSCALFIDDGACACLYTSGVAALRQDKHTPARRPPSERCGRKRRCPLNRSGNRPLSPSRSPFRSALSVSCNGASALSLPCLPVLHSTLRSNTRNRRRATVFCRPLRLDTQHRLP